MSRGVFCLTVHDENIHIRIKDVCARGVDVAIDFVSSTRTVNCVTRVLNKARNLYLIICVPTMLARQVLFGGVCPCVCARVCVRKNVKTKKVKTDEFI